MMNNNALIAPCGMNCSVCYAHLREKNKCPGCRVVSADKPISRVKCKIKTCEFFIDKKPEYCYECTNFPCKNIKHLDKRYRTKYHMSMVENLNEIKTKGLETFLGNQKKKYTCKDCGGIICTHNSLCVNCGNKHKI